MTSRLRWVAAGGAILIIGLIVAGAALNPLLTRELESPGFHSMLEKETAKGLHLQNAHYAPVNRVGLLGMSADWGAGDHGQKTIVALEGNQVTGAFNPLGVFLRRWEISYLHFTSGTVWLQKTEGSPNEVKPKDPPWYLFFWPDRLYLRDIKVDSANVLFQLQDKESGLHSTYLEITPNGRDFDYDARGGTFTTPDTPRLTIQHIHLLVRKPKLTCQEMVLSDDAAHPRQQVRITGEAGLQEDRGIHAVADFTSMEVAPWLPEKFRSNVRGRFSGHLEYKSTGTGLGTAGAQGRLALADGVLHDFKAIQLYIAATKSPDPGDLPLSVCQTDVKLEQGAVSLENLEVESKDVFKIKGHVTIAKDKSLSGEVRLGLTEPYLRWLPAAETTIFTEEDGPYHVAVIHLSGTSAKPVQDLSPRIVRQLGKHPLVALKLFLDSSGSIFGN